MKALQTLLTYLLHLEKCQESTTFPASNMSHLTQIHSHHETHYKPYPDQCTYDCHLVHQMMTLPQKSPYQILGQLQQMLQSTQKTKNKEEEEDFQTVPLNDDHWTSKEIPERTLCIHEHGLPHGLCPYPCPYVNYQVSSYVDSLDLSDISEFEDYMVTSSDEDIQALEDMPY